MRKYEEQLRDRRERERRDYQAWVKAREERMREQRREIAMTWGAIYRSPAGRAELAIHADRMARLHRAADVALELHDAALLARVKQLIEREIIRDAGVLNHLRVVAAR